MVEFGGMSPSLSLGGLAILAGFLSLFAGLAGWGIKKLLKTSSSPLAFMLIPFVWTAKNLVVEHIVGGFPWCFEGYSQYLNIYFIQTAEWGGIHLTTFVVLTINVLLYLAVSRRDRRIWGTLLIVLVTQYSAGFFLYRHHQAATASFPIHRAGILQPNTRNEVLLSYDERDAKLREFLGDSEAMFRQGAEFVIWPEFSIAIYPLQNKTYFNIFREFTRKHGPIMAGFTDYKEFREIFNSLMLFDGDRFQKYDKVHLTPFGEYIPFSSVFSFVTKITDEVGETTPGTETHNLELKGGKIAPPICYELIFPELVREFIAKGGEVIVIASNDAWYGDSSALPQLMCMTTFRAVENRRFVLRSTTNGLSAVISGTGEILYQSSYNKKETHVAAFRYIRRQTLFTRLGYLFPYGCVVFLLGYLGYIGIIRYRGRRGMRDSQGTPV